MRHKSTTVLADYRFDSLNTGTVSVLLNLRSLIFYSKISKTQKPHGSLTISKRRRRRGNMESTISTSAAAAESWLSLAVREKALVLFFFCPSLHPFRISVAPLSLSLTLPPPCSHNNTPLSEAATTLICFSSVSALQHAIALCSSLLVVSKVLIIDKSNNLQKYHLHNSSHGPRFSYLETFIITSLLKPNWF